MAIRLSELLDRIRPAGAPGAPTDAEPQRELAAAEESARLVRLLERLDAEADDLVAEAARSADAIRAEGERAASVLRAELADRVAVATAMASSELDHAADDRVVSVTAAARAEIERLRESADLDRVAARVVDVIWRAVEEARS